MSEQVLTILGSGMVCGVGYSAPASCAAIRCGIDNFRETRFRDTGGEWITGSGVRLAKSWRGTQKLSKMLASVLRECLSEDTSLRLEEVPVLFCLAEKDRPGRISNLEEAVFLETERELAVSFHPRSRSICRGHVSVETALGQARELIYTEGFPRVIIAGADSLLVGESLRAYESQECLLTDENSNGFIPGEAAAAVIVGSLFSHEQTHLCCLGIGSALEEATETSGRVLRADGLVQAIQAALADADCSLASMDFRVTDIAGGQYGFKEAGLALTRLLKERKQAFDIWQPADCIGEVGAAAGTAILALCLAATRKGYAPGNRILCHLSNQDGARAAIVLSYQPARSANG